MSWSGWYCNFWCRGPRSLLWNNLSTWVHNSLSSAVALLQWEKRDSLKYLGPDFLSVRSLSLTELNSWAKLISQFSQFFDFLILSFQCHTTLKKKKSVPYSSIKLDSYSHTFPSGGFSSVTLLWLAVKDGGDILEIGCF